MADRDELIEKAAQVIHDAYIDSDTLLYFGNWRELVAEAILDAVLPLIEADLGNDAQLERQRWETLNQLHNATLSELADLRERYKSLAALHEQNLRIELNKAIADLRERIAAKIEAHRERSTGYGMTWSTGKNTGLDIATRIVRGATADTDPAGGDETA